MILRPSRFAATTALFATLAMPMGQASAADFSRLKTTSVQGYDASTNSADGWGRRRYRRDRFDAGDVIAGVLVLGGIAAILSAAGNRRDDDRRERVPRDARYPDSRYPDDPRSRLPGNEGRASSGLERAVDMCVAEIERDRNRVANVEEASRDAAGWAVSGTLADGSAFNCRIGNDGRIADISLGEGDDDTRYDGDDRIAGNPQYREDVYARARAGQRGESNVRYRSGPGAIDGDLGSGGGQPAYPGGPLPGEEGYEEAVAEGDYDT